MRRAPLFTPCFLALPEWSLFCAWRRCTSGALCHPWWWWWPQREVKSVCAPHFPLLKSNWQCAKVYISQFQSKSYKSFWFDTNVFLLQREKFLLQDKQWEASWWRNRPRNQFQPITNICTGCSLASGCSLRSISQKAPGHQTPLESNLGTGCGQALCGVSCIQCKYLLKHLWVIFNHTILIFLDISPKPCCKGLRVLAHEII